MLPPAAPSAGVCFDWEPPGAGEPLTLLFDGDGEHSLPGETSDARLVLGACLFVCVYVYFRYI
jgi:hypothetical protein